MGAPNDIFVYDAAVGRYIVVLHCCRKFPDDARQLGLLPILKYGRVRFAATRLWSAWATWHLWHWELSVSLNRYKTSAAPVLKCVRWNRTNGFFTGGEVTP